MVNQDWAADVRKYVPDADDAIIAGIVRYCGIALRKVDSSLVSFSDPKETARVRDGYCRKKLGLTDSDAVVDAAIAAVGERMKDDRTKNRVTVYYLLAEHFGKLGVFAGKARAGGAGAAVAATAMGAAGVAAMTADAPAPEPVTAAPPPPPPPPAPAPAPEPDRTPATLVGAAGAATGAAAAGTAAVAAGAAAAATAAAATRSDDDAHRAGGAGWSQPIPREPTGGFMFGALMGAVALIAGAALLAWFISSRMGGGEEAAAPVVAAAPAAPAPAPVAPPPAPPEGAGVIASEVAGRPMVSVYFASAEAAIAPDFETAVAPILAWLQANPGDMAQISGFNDPTGNAEFNADLARRRAEGVAAELRRLGVPEQQIDLEPPASATDTTTDLAGARRVEITVVPLS